MDYNDILVEINGLISKLDSIIDMMQESTENIIDLGNVNVELKNSLDKLDIIIDNLDDQNKKTMLGSAKSNITFATLDIIDNVNIYDKIVRLKDAKGTIMDFKAKVLSEGQIIINSINIERNKTKSISTYCFPIRYGGLIFCMN